MRQRFRLPAVERDGDGLPVVGVTERRLAFALAAVATVWFTLVACWELLGPHLAGHYAASASLGIVADNMLRWGIAGPVWEYTARPPAPSQYYCNHPWGIFWTTTLVMKIFGRHDFVCRLPAVLLSAATPPLLFALGRAIWRPAAGAAAAAAFVVLPITLAFAHFNALEVPVIAWSLLGLWGYVRFTQSGRARYGWLSLAGFALALNADWPAFVLVGLLLAFGLVRGLLPRKGWPFGRLRSYHGYVRYWALLLLVTAATVLLYLYLFSAAGKLSALHHQAELRSAGRQLPLAQVLASRRYWIELCFTPIAIGLGKAAAVICALRLLWRRYEHDLLPLLVLVMAAFQYLVFKQGADVHVYWPHYFAAFFALGMGAVTETVLALIALAERWLRKDRAAPPDRWLPVAAVLAVVVAVGLAIARDGVVALGYARGTGGRFNEKGLLIHSDGAKTAFLRWLEPQLDRRAVVGMHVGMKTTWSQVWTLGGRVVQQSQPLPVPGRGSDVYLADTRFLYDHLQAQLAASHHVVAVGPFWQVARRSRAAPIDGYRIVEREPSWLEWYLESGTEPVREVVIDPFLTWELRYHFDQPVAPPSGLEPASRDERRIAHNLAVAQGEPARATELRDELLAELQGPRVKFDNGIELLGSTLEDLGRLQLTLFFLAPGKTPHDVQLAVRSRVLERAGWSTTMADPTVRQVGIPLGLGPIRWRRGFIYSHPVVIRKRPGLEVFEAYFEIRNPPRGKRLPKPPRPVSGGRYVEVLRLP